MCIAAVSPGPRSEEGSVAFAALAAAGGSWVDGSDAMIISSRSCFKSSKLSSRDYEVLEWRCCGK